MKTEKSTPPLVLLAEDDPNDVFFLRRAFKQAGSRCQIIDVSNGEEAISYLSAEPHEHPVPALLLLDLKMPLVNGFDVLLWLQTKPELHEMPTIILSSSCLDLDVKKARELGARDYRVKPPSPDELLKLVREISVKWLPIETQPSVQSRRDRPAEGLASHFAE